MLRGERIQAKLVEALSEREWIVSHNGHLFQVRNHSALLFKEGALVNLVVENSNPLRFRLLGPITMGQYSRRA